MKKTLVLFATRTGLSYNIAQRIAEETGAELAAVSDGRNYSGTLGYLRAAIAGLKKVPYRNRPLDTEHPLEEYDQIVLAGPIWCEKWCSIIRRFLMDYGKSLHCPVHFVVTHMSDNAYEKPIAMADALLNTPHAELISLKTKIESEDEQAKHDAEIARFIEAISMP